MLKQLTRSQALMILREAFTALLPIVLVMNILVLIFWSADLFASWGWFNSSPILHGEKITCLYHFLLPLFFSLSLSSLLAKEKRLNLIGVQLIAMICFFRVTHFVETPNSEATQLFYKSSVLVSLISTWVSVRLLHYLSDIQVLHLVRPTDEISPRLRKTFELLLAALITVLTFELIGYYIPLLFKIPIFEKIATGLPHPKQMHELSALVLYKLVALTT